MTHQYAAQGLDLAGTKSSILDICIHVDTHVVNNEVWVNFNQEYVNIILTIISIFLYF
jgi:hypothetical protein